MEGISTLYGCTDFYVLACVLLYVYGAVSDYQPQAGRNG